MSVQVCMGDIRRFPRVANSESCVVLTPTLLLTVLPGPTPRLLYALRRTLCAVVCMDLDTRAAETGEVAV